MPHSSSVVSADSSQMSPDQDVEDGQQKKEKKKYKFGDHTRKLFANIKKAGEDAKAKREEKK